LASYHSSNLQPFQEEKANNKGKDAGEFQPLKTAIVSSAHAIHDTYSGFISPLIPFLIERFSLLKVEASYLLFLYQGISILQPIIGHWADRINLRKIALIAPAITGIFLSLLGNASSFRLALLYCFLAGISSAAMHAILPALVSTYSGKDTGKGMSFWMVGGELGVMFGPIIITAVIATSSIKNTPWLMIGGIAISILLNILLKDEPYVIANPDNSIKIPTKELLAIMLPLGGIIALRSLLRASSEIYLPVYLIEKGAGVWLAGASLSILQGFGVLGVILGGFANDRYGFKPVLLASIVFSGLGMVAFVFTSGIIQILSLTVLGAASMMMLPIGMAIVQDYFPENRSLSNGIYLAMLFAINAVTGVLTGFMYDHLGGQQTFLIGGLVIFLAIPFVYILPKYEKSPTI
jgi:FSR family fosmidomycin resistance protein-like MFS transporter